MKPYDYMALVPIVLGAGGIMTDWQVLGIALPRDFCTPFALTRLPHNLAPFPHQL